jgi:signal transduction histidine kinase
LAASDAATALAPGLPVTADPGGATTRGAREVAVSSAAPAARRPIAVAPIANGLFGFVPATFVEGDFVAAVQLMDGMWAVVQPTPEPFPNAWQRRLLLWFAVAAAVVMPLGWLFSRRLVRPITAFAAAAEQLGRDPTASILPLEGPAEVGRAAHAFNRMQSRLRSFVDDRTAMIGAISHDLRTPLTRMRFRVEDIPDDQREGMLLEVQEMEQMITSVLAFIRDASEPGARETLDLSSLVEDVVEDAVFVGHDVVLDRTEKAAVDVDAIGMRRLLSNLVENAVKYGERAHVRLFTDRNDAVAEISDDGPGLPDDELERVFQPFYRGPNARASAKQGSGLGLAVCRSIARGHGGDVQLTRGARGLVARVRLPLAYGAAARP